MAVVNIAELRKAKRRNIKAFTQTECAKILGVSLPTYRKYEKDPSLMSLEEIKTLSSYLGLDPSIFLK